MTIPTTPADLERQREERLREEFEAWHIGHYALPPEAYRKEHGQYANLRLDGDFEVWKAASSRPVTVTEEMVANAASELGNPTIPTVFSRCIEEDGKRVYVTGYTNDDGSEVIRYRGNSGLLAESDHFDLENEVLARAVLSAALRGGV